MVCEVIKSEINEAGDYVFHVRQGAGQAFPYRVTRQQNEREPGRHGLWSCTCGSQQATEGPLTLLGYHCDHIRAALSEYLKLRNRINRLAASAAKIATDLEIVEQTQNILDEKRTITLREEKNEPHS